MRMPHLDECASTRVRPVLASAGTVAAARAVGAGQSGELPYGRFPVRIAAQIQPERCGYVEIRRAAERLKDIGVDVPESGPLVTCAAYQNPDPRADMARTVDHISNGPLILGVGASWSDRDFSEYDYEQGTASPARITRGLPRLNPQPCRNTPILVGGNAPRREAFDAMDAGPDVIVQAVSSGMGVLEGRKGAAEFLAQEQLTSMSRSLMVQEDNCAPMASAWRDGRSELSDCNVVTDPTGIPFGIPGMSIPTCMLRPPRLVARPCLQARRRLCKRAACSGSLRNWMSAKRRRRGGSGPQRRTGQADRAGSGGSCSP